MYRYDLQQDEIDEMGRSHVYYRRARRMHKNGKITGRSIVDGNSKPGYNCFLLKHYKGPGYLEGYYISRAGWEELNRWPKAARDRFIAELDHGVRRGRKAEIELEEHERSVAGKPKLTKLQIGARLRGTRSIYDRWEDDEKPGAFTVS